MKPQQPNMVIRVVTTVGGTDVIGEIMASAADTGWERVWHPFHLMPQPKGLALRQMLGEPSDNKFIIAGDYITINMRNVLWINPPVDALKKAYIAARSGLVISSTIPMAANQ